MTRSTSCWVLTAALLSTSAPARADDAEDRAVKFVEESRGKVQRDDKRPGRPVVAVNWVGRVTDADLKELAPLKELVILTVQSLQVTDVGLKELAGLKNLEVLN